LIATLRLIAIFVILVGVALIATNVQALHRVDKRLILAILAAQAPILLGQAFIALRLECAVGWSNTGFLRCFCASLFGQAVELVVPWRLSELAKVIYLRDKAEVPYAVALAAVVMERLADLIVVCALALSAASLVVIAPSVRSFALTSIVIVVAFLALPRAAPLISRLIDFIPIFAIRSAASNLLNEIVVRLKNRTLWLLLAPTAIAWTLTIIATWLFLTVVEVKAGCDLLPIGVGMLLTLVVATTIGGIVAVLPAGLGSYEAGVVLVLSMHGVSIEEAVPVGIALHLAHMLIGAIGGAAVGTFSPLRWREQIDRASGALAGPR
jgi:uncharacterized membrane protein YbhN (UPF0104 family)